MNRQQVIISTFLLIILLCGIGILQTEPGDRAEHVIRISLLGSTDDEDYDGVMSFKHHVESNASGNITVEVYPSGQFCSTERECLESLQSGVLQVFMFTTGGIGSIYGPAQVLDLPYTFRDDNIAECVLDGPIVSELGRTLQDEGLGVRLMTVSNTGGWRNFATTDRPIHQPEHIRGLKIRTITAPLQQELVRQLGANPTPISWPEVYTALATGVVDGTKNGIHDIVSMQLHEQIKYVTLDRHAYMGGLWLYSEASWQALSDDQQKIVQAGFDRLKTTTREAIGQWETESYARFTESGGTLFIPDDETKNAFKASVADLRNWYRQTYGDTWLDRLDIAVQQCEET